MNSPRELSFSREEADLASNASSAAILSAYPTMSKFSKHLPKIIIRHDIQEMNGTIRGFQQHRKRVRSATTEYQAIRKADHLSSNRCHPTMQGLGHTLENRKCIKLFHPDASPNGGRLTVEYPFLCSVIEVVGVILEMAHHAKASIGKSRSRD